MNLDFDYLSSPDWTRHMHRTMERTLVRGVGLAAFAAGGRAQLSQYGVVNTETGAPVTASTLFEAASLTKPVFAWLACELESQGVLELDAPLSRYLDVAEIVADARRERITARHVLSHRTGLPNWSPKPAPLLFEPGARFGYSGEGYLTLQRAVEKLTGQGLEELLRERVFTPFSMDHSACVWTPSINARLSRTFDREGAMEPARSCAGYSIGPEPNAACSLYTTAEDYASFLLGMMQRNPARLAHMLEKQTHIGPALDWGLGWGLLDCGQTLAWHWGDNGGFQAFTCFSLTGQTGLVLLTNSASSVVFCLELATHLTGIDLSPVARLIDSI